MAKLTPGKKKSNSTKGSPAVSRIKNDKVTKSPVGSAQSTPTRKAPKSPRNAKSPKGQEVKTAPVAQKEKEDKSVIPRARIIAAISELRKYADKKCQTQEDEQLLGDEELVQSAQLIAVNTTSFSGSSKIFKPKQLAVPHSLYKPWRKASQTALRDFKVLVVLKDADVSKITEDELYDALEPKGVAVDAVVGAGDFKTKYKSFEKRRVFLQQFSLVLADDSVISALPKLVGGKAYEKTATTPVPIRTGKKGVFSSTTLANSIEKVYLHQLPVKLPRGTTLNAHLGNLEWFTAENLAENVSAMAEQLVAQFQIRALFLKTSGSPVLPLYYNNDLLKELTQTAAAKAKKSEKPHVAHKVTIGDVEVELSHFDRALMEIANPDELDKVFAGRVANAKKRAADESQDLEPETPKRIKA
ncbi:LAMI_0D03444g1_1 [Lachancea mirantina]|uniref:LAMI_0D03444g1_1 n=1 Tax=Lachancea mirantina TaxID=1230905 RepID=A0A1G4J9Q5_9SACH|nr:LAMI_0D03444g1_1 [Lachancea mirantina]